MKEARIKVVNSTGLHARPAARLVEVAASFDGTVEIKNLTTDSIFANAKSILGVLTLGVEYGHEIVIRTEEPEACVKLADLVRHELPQIDGQDRELGRADGEG